MPKNCFVPGCKTIFKNRCNRKPGEKTLTFFGAPKDPVLRKQWHIASRRGDREMTVKDVMCELHFTEDCLLRYFTTELYDGSIFKLERDRPALKKGSIPTIFPFFKSNLDSKKRGRKKKPRIVESEQEENGSQDSDLCRNLSLSKQGQVLACSAYGCNNNSYKEIPGLLFHRFPTDKLQRAWMKAVRQKDLMPSKGGVLCSAHFAPDQFEQTGSYVKLKFCAIPTIFFSGGKHKMNRLPVHLQTDEYDSSDSDRNECYLRGISESADQDSNEDELPVTDTDSFVQDESDEIPKGMPTTDEEMPCTSENFIFKGHEDIFGKFVASELQILSCDPPLYLRTKEKIWQVLEKASQKLK